MKIIRYKKHRIYYDLKTKRYEVAGLLLFKSLRRAKAEIDFLFYGIGNIINNKVYGSPHYKRKKKSASSQAV